MSMIEVQNLKYKYPDTEKLVLDDISFTVEKGEFIGLVGRNTAGKSTLCFALSGLVPHFFKGGYGGKVTIADLEVGEHEISDIVQKVGLIFENPFSQITGSKFTVYNEIAFGLENMGISREEMRQRIDESLETLRITGIKDRSPFELSGGQMQRVAIASVMAMQPDVLILDEPTSQLDPRGSEDVFKVVENLSQQGMTIIMAEHKMEKLAENADRILVLDDGKKVDFDVPEKVFSRDDLHQHGIVPPVVTQVAQELQVKNRKTGWCPILVRDFPQENVVNNDD